MPNNQTPKSRPHQGCCSVCGHDLGIGTAAELDTVLAIHARWKPRHEGARVEDRIAVGATDYGYAGRGSWVMEVVDAE